MSKSQRVALFVVAMFATVGVAYVLGVAAAGFVQKIKIEKFRAEQTREILARMGSGLGKGVILPDAEFENLTGHSVRLSEVVGPRSMICIFSPDCGACDAALDRIRAKAVGPDAQSRFILISDTDPVEIDHIRDSLGLQNCHFLYDHNGAYQLKLGVMTFPFILTVNQSLIIEDVMPGAPDMSQLEKVVDYRP
jgi:peroxiredoxin